MSILQREGGRLLARLARGVSADTTTSLALQTHHAIPTHILNVTGVRHLAGGDDTSSRPGTLGGPPVEPQPPPPGSPTSQPPNIPPATAAASSPVTSAASAFQSLPPQPAISTTQPPPSSSTSIPDTASTSAAFSSSLPSDLSCTKQAATPGLPFSGNPSDPTAVTAAALKAQNPESNDTGSEGKSASTRDDSDTGDKDGKRVDRRKGGGGHDADDGSNQDDPDNPESVHVYHEFYRRGELRELHSMMEEALRLKAYEGLQGSGGFLSGPNRAWSFLYDDTSARLVATAAPIWSASVMLKRLLVTGPTGELIRKHVDHSFNAAEFMESISQAVPVFFDTVASSDFNTLSNMCSPRAVEALARDRRRLRDELGLEVSRVDTTVRQAAMTGANLWGPVSIRAFDPAWAGEFSPDLSKSWLVVVVLLDVSLTVSYRRVNGNGGEGGVGVGVGLGTGEQGQEFQLPVRRWGRWLMARGPLPKGPAESLDSSWKLLAWY